MADLRFYVKELMSDECMCGKPKDPGKSFCWTCWKKLPCNLHRPLYCKILNGYEQAYDDAHAWLTREGE